ncbi:MAG TPA: type I-E CRISPR-associated endonuclease Cas1 [Bacteroidaceae bacterium]|nr:type I-E CRISPR-associated endonuclease Cas1 [Bacteroidaceae bacterium]
MSDLAEKKSKSERSDRLFIKVLRGTLPQVKEKYPFIYLEYGRLEIDDSSVKWIDCDGNIIRLPVATINSILLGPGTSVTHEAVKVLASANCMLCWVGQDSLIFYATGLTPTSDTRNMRLQMNLACNKKQSIEVARRMFSKRFIGEDLSGKSLEEMMGMEGKRVKMMYCHMADKYQVGWKGRSYKPGNFDMSDLTNKILTSSNSALYSILNSAVCSMGYSPHIGFIHSGSPLPFIYDMADLYKEQLCVDLAFSITRKIGGVYNKHFIASEFRKRVIDFDLLGKIGTDIKDVLGK